MAGTRKLMSKTVRVKKDDTLEKYSLFKGEQKVWSALNLV